MRALSFLLGGFVPLVNAASWALKAFWGTAAAPGLAVRGFATVQAAGVRAFVAIGAGWTALRAALTWGSIRGALVAGFSALSAAALSSFAAIGVGWKALKSALTWGSVRAALVAGFGTLAAVGAAAWGAIGSAALAAWTVMTGGTIWIVIGIIAALAAAGALLVAAWKPVSTFFGGLWQGLSEGSGRVGEAFGRLLDALGPVGEGIRGIVGTGIGAVFSWLVNLFGEQTDLGRGWGDAIIDGAVAVIDFLTTVIETIQSLIGWVAKIPSGVGGLFSDEADVRKRRRDEARGWPAALSVPHSAAGFQTTKTRTRSAATRATRSVRKPPSSPRSAANYSVRRPSPMRSWHRRQSRAGYRVARTAPRGQRRASNCSVRRQRRQPWPRPPPARVGAQAAQLSTARRR